MAEVFGLTRGAIDVLTPIVRDRKGRLPDVGQVKRKVYPPARQFARYRITQEDGGDPVAIYRTSHASGFDAVKLVNDSDTSTGPTTTIYATLRSIRSVFRTNDIVWARTVDGEVQVVDFGRVHWTGEAVDNIAPDSPGDVILYSGENVTVEALNWTDENIATEDPVRIEWDDEFQRFLIVATRC